MSLGCYSVHPLYYGLKPEIVLGLKQNNLAIYAWTVNETRFMKMLIQGAIDAIITDHPQDL